MSAGYISENEFWEHWGVMQKADGELFDYEDVKDLSLNHVWTILESGTDHNNNWYASPGFHYVNRLAYVLTKKPWVDELRDAIYFLDDMARDDDDCGKDQDKKGTE